MEPVAIGDLRSEYYDANSDFPGLWELDENRREDVDFRNSSSIRIRSEERRVGKECI